MTLFTHTSYWLNGIIALVMALITIGVSVHYKKYLWLMLTGFAGIFISLSLFFFSGYAGKHAVLLQKISDYGQVISVVWLILGTTIGTVLAKRKFGNRKN